jgi:hypothetical protein
MKQYVLDDKQLGRRQAAKSRNAHCRSSARLSRLRQQYQETSFGVHVHDLPTDIYVYDHRLVIFDRRAHHGYIDDDSHYRLCRPFRTCVGSV